MKHTFYNLKKPQNLSTRVIMISMLCLLTILTGCQPVSQTADLHICLEHYQPSDRTIAPDEPLTVASYQVSGAGPDGTSFTITTDDTQITVSGLLTGDWDVSAIGFSSDGVGLVEGTSVITLSNSTSSGQISMDEFYGVGSAALTIAWDSSQTISPSVTTYMLLCGSLDSPQELTASTATEGEVTYSLPDLPAGAYLIMSELYSDSLMIAGATEILRIVDDTTTSDTITMEFNDLQLDLGMSLIDDSAAPIEGSITGIPLTITANQPMEISFVPSPGSIQTGLTCTWYLDGQFLNQGNPITFVSPSGKHRIDVVVTSANLGSTGSAGQSIQAVESAATGAPLLYAEYVEGEQDDLQLDGISDIAVLPDGLIVTAAKYSDSLQVMRIESDTLALKQTVDTDATNLLDGASKISSSADGTFIAVASENAKTVTIYDHSTGTDTISQYQTLLQTGTNANGSYQFNIFGGIALNSDGSMLFVADKSTDQIIVFTRSGASFSFKGNYSFTPTPDIEAIRSIAVGYDDEVLALASYDTNSMHLLKIESDGALSISYSIDYGQGGYYGLSNASQVFFPDTRTIFLLAGDTISEYLLSDSVFGVPTFTQSSRLKEDTNIPVDFSPKDICGTSDLSKLFIVTSTGKGIVQLSHDTTTNLMSYDSFATTDDLVPDTCAVSIDNSFLLVGSSTDDTLQLYRFSL